MDFLVVSPPVTTPAEPPSGAFTLASALAGWGHDVGLFDLSLEFYHRILSDPSQSGPSTGSALRYLMESKDGYDPARHRGAVGVLHKRLADFHDRFPGWKLTLMDIEAPRRAHDPESLGDYLRTPAHNPFSSVIEDVFVPMIERHRPRRVLISLAYLSQLAGTIALGRRCSELGVDAVVGGSFPTSLAATGVGMDALERVLPPILVGDGRELIGLQGDESFLNRLMWPRILSETPYLSCRPIVPLPLSTGCYWGRCLFCPDRQMVFRQIPANSLDAFLASMPRPSGRPVVHLLDSAIPAGGLRRFAPIAAQHDVGFYGFARPDRLLLKDNLLELAAESGCAMLQLGVESGSPALLRRYEKGIDPEIAQEALRRAAGAGIRTYVYLLFGLPGEDASHREMTKELLVRNAESVDFLNLSLFNLPRTCELTERSSEFGILLGDFPGDDTLRLYWPFTCADGSSPRRDARRFVNEQLVEHPAVRRAYLATPRWLRAAHLSLMSIPKRRPI